MGALVLCKLFEGGRLRISVAQGLPMSFISEGADVSMVFPPWGSALKLAPILHLSQNQAKTPPKRRTIVQSP
jgi:hypothetical protein